MTNIQSSLDFMRYISGYGRELFVSNVIKFIGDYYPQIFAKIFAKYLSEDTEFSVKREWQNTDIAVFFKNHPKPHIILENKIGAAISESQLEKYSKYVEENGHLILLSLREPIKLEDKWQYMGYDTLVEKMKPCLNGQTFEMEFLRHFCEYLQSLHSEVESLRKEIEENRNSKSLKDIISKHDKRPYIGRAMYEAFSMLLQQELDQYSVTVSTGITHATPMLELIFNIKADNGAEYVVQLQDNCLVIGFCIENKGKYSKQENGKLDRLEKQINRAQIWNDYAPEVLKRLTEVQECKKMNGYTTEKYIMPTVRVKCDDLTIDRLIAKITEIVEKIVNNGNKSN